MHRVTWSIVGVICGLASLPIAPVWGLTLDEALARAALKRFEIAAIPGEVQASEGNVLEASVSPAAELDLETQSDLGEAKIEVIFLQERGGKREARVAAARATREALGAQMEVRRLDVGHQVRTAFTAVLAAEQSLRLTEDAHALARSLAEAVAEKVRAGAASPIEQTRAAVRLHGAAAEVERARREAGLARADLALAVGDDGVRSEPLQGSLPDDLTVPQQDLPATHLSALPDLKHLDRQVAVRRSLLTAEQSQSARDVSWRAGAHYNNDENAAWISVGITIPLSASGRNRGALAAATADLDRAERERAAAERRRTAEWGRTQTTLDTLAREARILRDEVLAGAERAFATVQEGYRLGKFPYLDVLDASQVLLDARLQYTGVLAALAQARIDVNRLLGVTDLPTITASR